MVSWDACTEKTAATSVWGRLDTLRQEVWPYKTPLFLNTVLEGWGRGEQMKIGQMGAEKGSVA